MKQGENYKNHPALYKLMRPHKLAARVRSACVALTRRASDPLLFPSHREPVRLDTRKHNGKLRQRAQEYRTEIQQFYEYHVKLAELVSQLHGTREPETTQDLLKTLCKVLMQYGHFIKRHHETAAENSFLGYPYETGIFITHEPLEPVPFNPSITEEGYARDTWNLYELVERHVQWMPDIGPMTYAGEIVRTKEQFEECGLRLPRHPWESRR